MRRMSAIFLPILAVIAAVFGLYYVYLGVQTARTGEKGAAAILIVFGFAGFALGMALWRVIRLLQERASSR